MQKIVIGIIMFAIVIALVVGVVIPIFNQGHATGQSAKNQYEIVDTDITNLAIPVN